MKRVISLLVLLFFTTAAAPEGLTSSFQIKKKQNANRIVVGNWTLTRIGNTDGRTINFAINKARQLEGKYVTSSGAAKSISNARFDGKTLYFRVPDLQLYFEMWVVEDRFEGKMTTYSTNEKLTPEPVTMSRKK